MMPETWVPTSTSVTGSTVPVAITELRMVMRLVEAVSSVMSSLRWEPAQSQAPPASTMAASAAKSVVLCFMILLLLLLLLLSI